MENKQGTKPMSLKASYPVVMHNNLIKAVADNGLSIKAAKLWRITIMNILADDTDFQTYRLTVNDFAELLQLKSSSNLYAEVDHLTDELMAEIVRAKDDSGKLEKYQLVSGCEYYNGEITIRIHDKLKPYLLELKKHYTKYALADILCMSTTATIRLYELIVEGVKKSKLVEVKEEKVYLSLEDIRKAINLPEHQYQQFGMFKKRIIDKAVDEINSFSTLYFVQYKLDKAGGRKVVGIEFEVMNRAAAMHRQLLVPKDNTNTQNARRNQNRRKSPKKDKKTHMDSEKKAD